MKYCETPRDPYQHKTVQPCPEARDGLPKQLQKMPAVPVVAKDGFAFVAAGDHMLPEARLFNAQRPGHAASLSRAPHLYIV